MAGSDLQIFIETRAFSREEAPSRMESCVVASLSSGGGELTMPRTWLSYAKVTHFRAGSDLQLLMEERAFSREEAPWPCSRPGAMS